ncbi:MAG: Fe2+-dependent dioxygenase [Betaproteobacteria bacterium]|nr:Fe2+-dependent dioxygenase [Betaproteobacteria bacterium]
MIITLPQLLKPEQVAHTQALLASAAWQDGRSSAGDQAVQVKNNEQLPHDDPVATQLRDMVMQALDREPLFLSAALPKKILPPRFNRYGGESNFYGQHVDNAIRFAPDTRERIRTDISCTVFLADPADYDGGELVVHEAGRQQQVKLSAGSAVLYPGTSVHEVLPVTRGARLACFFWIESMVRLDEQRRILFEMDMALMKLRTAHGDNPATVALTGTYHNLLRLWADT